MSITKHVARLAIELLVGWVLIWALTIAVGNAMFYFGPWADPPGVEEGHQVLMVLLPIVCGYRAFRRLRADRQSETDP